MKRLHQKLFSEVTNSYTYLKTNNLTVVISHSLYNNDFSPFNEHALKNKELNTFPQENDTTRELKLSDEPIQNGKLVSLR